MDILDYLFRLNEDVEFHMPVRTSLGPVISGFIGFEIDFLFRDKGHVCPARSFMYVDGIVVPFADDFFNDILYRHGGLL